MNTETEHIHTIAAETVFELLQTQPTGLTDQEAAVRRSTVGSNRLESASRWRWIQLLAKQLLNFFSILLDLAATACFVAGAVQPGEGMGVLGGALLVVSLLNALFAFAQEMRAERAMDELRKFLPQFVGVLRNGRELQIAADLIVPGDVVLLTEGERIPADARVVESEGLLVNNAPLSGESRAQPLRSTTFCGRLTDSPNIAFAGCSVLRGSGTAVVFATGHHTEFGKVAALSRDIRRPPSPIEQETNRMIRVLTMIALVMGGLFFAYGVASGRSLWVNIVFMLGIIVANVPEGLLPTFTLALSMAGLRMAKKQVLIKSLQAVESLGAVHVVCTDKTGTLTKNELAIAAAVDPLRGDPLDDPDLHREFLKAALIASEVREHASDTKHSTSLPSCADHPQWSGDPLDVAIAQRYADLFDDPTLIIQETLRHFPFDLQKRREAGVFANGEIVLFAVKGAWESLRPLIGSVEQPGKGSASATPELLAESDQVVHRLSARDSA